MYVQEYADRISAAEQLIRTAPHVESETDLLEGLQYLAGCIAACTRLVFDYQRDHPFLHTGTGPFTKMALDNPDTLYLGTWLQAGHEYEITGYRGTTTDVSFQLLSGEYSDNHVPISEFAFDDRELDIASDRSFRFRFSPRSDAQLVIREVYNDWSAQRGTVAITRTDSAGTAPSPLTATLIENRYAAAGKQLTQRIKTWLTFPRWYYLNVPVNTLTAPRITPGGLATQYSSVGHFDLAPGQAMVITLPASDAPYLGFQLGSMWYISLDYINHQTSLNGAQAQVDPDGMIRIVVAHENPGITNWVETLGHRRGYLQFRWQRTARELTEADGPIAEIVDLDSVPAKLPYHAHNTISSYDFRSRIALRQKQIANRMVA
ncbi:hypothetical protein ORI20_12900 [Mycobacterium sp. CVI_P3]|uniref:DUF1214 domain-containing protein n=1 Tax=Mycobacterium pinniadriaticum TaxID=2994102 RepID=A0ABT3SDN7_9MYCO|nr:hypothetical protein [Mycobacterium pinniadriaticum]MCX2931181.1 hypothetical protein [Mycobacterium pinniadriaticum]MCX2937595.1 hypothetical protein [Mycobacterium pinniadriaticum]